MQLNERIGHRMKLRDLNILLAVAKERSMSKAAAQLGLAQPAVSKAVADMEYILGAPLFDRGPRGVEPTLYGRALIDRSVVIFDELRQSVKDVESLLDPSVGDVRVGSAGPLAAGVVPAVIDTLMRRYPRASIHVIDAALDGLLRELRDRNIDLAIGTAVTPVAEEDMKSETLFYDRLLVVAGLRSKWAPRRKIKLAELLTEPWVFPPAGTIPGQNIENAFRAAGSECPRPSVPTASISVIVQLLAAGRFLSVLPGSMVRFGSKNLPLKTLPVELAVPQMPIVIVTLKNRTLSPLAKLFIDTAQRMLCRQGNARDKPSVLPRASN
jgi:DNA-binding transcriptional LysR family regulator